VPVQPAAVELLAALAPVAERWGRWCVFGAQAVVVYGVPRLSADVDVTLALVPDAPEQFARDMQAAGFSLRVSDPDFVRRTRVPIIDVGDLMIAKVLAGRPKDVDDARALWRLHGREVNEQRIRHILRLLEEALSQSDLVSSFESMSGARPRSS
jgi:hypothetical protein